MFLVALRGSGECEKTRLLCPEAEDQGSPGSSKGPPVKDLNEGFCSPFGGGGTCFLPSPHPIIRAFKLLRNHQCLHYSGAMTDHSPTGGRKERKRSLLGTTLCASKRWEIRATTQATILPSPHCRCMAARAQS